MGKTFLECSENFSRMHTYMFYIVVKFQTPSYNTFGDIPSGPKGLKPGFTTSLNFMCFSR